jgi:hypothetical protein
MWSRVIEILFGAWLCASPFLFGHSASNLAWSINDMATGACIMVFGLLSFWQPTRRAHLFTLLVAFWLIGFAYYHGFGDAPSASQNQLAVGLMLLMFAVIPNHASDPPRTWARTIKAN